MPGITVRVDGISEDGAEVGSSFKSQRNTDPLAPAYHLSLDLSAVDHETLRTVSRVSHAQVRPKLDEHENGAKNANLLSSPEKVKQSCHASASDI
eukprot:754044-Hanusia_phi.AAC.3